jgi:hypothetical protein
MLRGQRGNLGELDSYQRVLSQVRVSEVEGSKVSLISDVRNGTTFYSWDPNADAAALDKTLSIENDDAARFAAALKVYPGWGMDDTAWVKALVAGLE